MSKLGGINRLRRKIQMDIANCGGIRAGGKADRGSVNKIHIATAVSINHAGYSIHAIINALNDLTSEAIDERDVQHLAPGWAMLRDD